MKLQLIGYWKTSDRPELPLPQDLVDKAWESEERRKVAAYLRQGAACMSYMGYSYCRFPDGPSPKEMGCRDFSDGIWAWPEGLAVYVERYSVGLPEPFLEHVREQSYVFPQNAHNIHFSKDGMPWYLFDDWIKFYLKNANISFLEKACCYIPFLSIFLYEFDGEGNFVRRK